MRIRPNWSLILGREKHEGEKKREGKEKGKEEEEEEEEEEKEKRYGSYFCMELVWNSTDLYGIVGFVWIYMGFVWISRV